MMHRPAFAAISILVLTAVPVLGAPPTPEQLVSKVLEAAGGADALAKLGMIRFDVEEQETLANGRQFTSSMAMVVYGSNPDNARLEFGRNAIVVRNEGDAWALLKGELDDRPQATKMARGTVNQKVFPLMLPLSLTMDGVTVSNVIEAEFAGTPSWRANLTLPVDFFVAPSMRGEWVIEVNRETGELIAAGVLPPESMHRINDEGVRYQVLQTTGIDGVRVPTKVLLEGISVTGSPTGHNRIVTLEPKLLGRFDPALFIHPDRLEAIEEGME